VDHLSAFFLLPVLGLSALAAIYGGSYLLAFRRQKWLGWPWFLFNLFVAAMGMVVIARTAFLFLVAWEVMSLTAFALVAFEQEKAEVRRAGWTYLIAAHVGVAFLIVVLALLGRQAGSLEFAAFRRMPPPVAGGSGLIFVLALVGFGTKAGFVPFHVWLPEAHPAAPSHVSALMSGVMIKMGIYGLLRVLTFLGPPAGWWGLTLGALGLLTAVVGIALALHQRDLKRVLAYSSIENMGLIGLALGVGLCGEANGMPALAALGMAAALLHIWNHTLMKGLLFFAAGSVLHGTGTKDIEKLGGVMQRMPWTASPLMIGSVAIAALPPLNGFVSKWLLYLGLLKFGFANHNFLGLGVWAAVGLLALVGALAALAFVRLTGIALLGSPRSEGADEAHESSAWMFAPMLLLVAFCLGLAVRPRLALGLLPGVLHQLPGNGASAALVELDSSEVPLSRIGVFNAWALLTVAAVMVWLWVRMRQADQAEGPTWGCGYVQPTARMQYTGRSFAEVLAEHLLPRSLRPRTSRELPEGLFPAKSRFRAEDPDPFRDHVYDPLFTRMAERFTRLRILQQGQVHVYLVYVVLTVALALAWVSVRRWLPLS
jgi:formate hydrogenlyase subunit 3/multisubunit Na+/H+ antiporter MnhD subunit